MASKDVEHFRQCISEKRSHRSTGARSENIYTPAGRLKLHTDIDSARNIELGDTIEPGNMIESLIASIWPGLTRHACPYLYSTILPNYLNATNASIETKVVCK